MNVHHIYVWYQKEGLDLLQMELETACKLLWVLGIEPGSTEQLMSVLNC